MEPPLALSSLLLPWLDTLRGLCLRAVASDPPTSSSSAAEGVGVWLQWTVPPDAPLSRCLEDVELLVLLAWADRSAWRDVARQLHVLDRDAPAVRVLGYDVVCSRQGDARVFCDHLSEGAVPPPRDGALSDFQYARGILERAAGAVEIPVRLRLKPSNPRDTYDDGLFAALALLAMLQKGLEDSTEATNNETTCRLAGFRSHVRYILDDNYPSTTIDEARLSQMAMLWSRGVRVTDLPPMCFTLNQRKRDVCAASHQKLLGVGCEGCVCRLAVSNGADKTETVGLLSALAHSSSAREVSFYFDQTREGGASGVRCVVLWLAYALLSAHATGAVRKLSLRCRYLTMHRVNIMRELLAADDPLELLFPRHTDSIRTYRDVRVSASRLLLDESTSEIFRGSSPHSWMTHIAFKDLRAISRTEHSWGVFLPGWGQAWVKIEHASVSQVAFTASVLEERVCPIDELHLSEFREENDEALLAFLGLFRGGVRALQLSDSNRPIDMLCPRIFSACPNLEEFVLREVVSNHLGVFVESFADGRCERLKKLTIKVQLLAETTIYEVQQMFEALADPKHPMAQQLESLKINTLCMINGATVVDSDVLNTVLRMLQNNKRLTGLELNLPLSARDMSAVQRLENEFTKHHDESLPTPVAPLSARKKAAFLSVVWGNASHRQSAMQLFDRRIVSAIFDFVPERRHRRIDIAMPVEFVDEEH